MLILTILVIGMFSGWIANLIVNKGKGENWTRLFLIGVSGSLVGGLLFSLLAGDGLAIEASGLIGSIVGAVIILGIAKATGHPSLSTGKHRF